MLFVVGGYCNLIFKMVFSLESKALTKDQYSIRKKSGKLKDKLRKSNTVKIKMVPTHRTTCKDYKNIMLCTLYVLTSCLCGLDLTFRIIIRMICSDLCLWNSLEILRHTYSWM